MINSELNPNPEFKDQEKNREIFIKIAEDFLLDNPVDQVEVSKMSNKELGEYIQQDFQKNLKNFFEESGLAKEITECKDDDDALHLIANKSEGVHGWMDMLPNLVKLQLGSGMNCTMGSAMLHIGLEQLDFKNVRTVHVKGHSIVMRELDGGSIKLYDANSKSTVNGKLLGYTHTFSPSQVSNRKEIEEKSGRKGFQFSLDRGELDEQGGFHIQNSEGKFNKNFYAYDPSIKMDVATAIGNLGEIKQDAEILGGVKDLPLIDRNDYLKAIAQYIQRNNTTQLRDGEIEAVERENPDVINQILTQAEKNFISGDDPPNPFDYLKSDLIKPNENLGPLPSTDLFMKYATERHEHAKKLISDYAELKDLDSDTIQSQFELFSAEPYID